MAMMGMWMRISDALHGVYDRTEWSSTAPIEGEGGGGFTWQDEGVC